MKSRWLVVGLLAAQLAQPAMAQVKYYTIFLPREVRPWTVRKQDPYAMWNGQSASRPSSEVTLDRHSLVIDSAPLVPDNLYSTDRDLIEGSRVWLPKGSLLVKMHGGTASWWCTARFDNASSASASEAAKDDLSGFEYNLCLQADSEGHASNPKIMIADFKGLMTITDQESGMGRYRNGISSTSSVMLSPVETTRYPVRIKVNISIDRKRHPQNSVCLKMTLTDSNDKPFMEREESCFSDLNQPVEVAGGLFTLTDRNGEDEYKVRVDRPININGLAPRSLK